MMARSLGTTLYDFLDTATDHPKPRSTLFVFAGRPHRKTIAHEMMAKNDVADVIYSVGRFEWRRFSREFPEYATDLLPLVEQTPPLQRHFFIHVIGGEVRTQAVRKTKFGTMNEVLALKEYVHNSGVQDLILLSDAFHLRRVRAVSYTHLRAHET